MSNPGATAAEELVGVVPDTRWRVTARRAKPLGVAGGHFSVGNEAVYQQTSEPVFVKALDLEMVLRGGGRGVDVQGH